jgi:phosphinothricin acetyltransferase
MPATEAIVRDATLDDVDAIERIYAYYVENTTYTFDTSPMTAEDRRSWMLEHDLSHPVLVAERGGTVVGWGSLNRWSTRAAYDQTVEISTYVDCDHVGTGIGGALAAVLLARARAAGHHAVVSYIVAGNEASLRLSEKSGFERVGFLREVGRKFERWLDVVVMEKLLG